MVRAEMEAAVRSMVNVKDRDKPATWWDLICVEAERVVKIPLDVEISAGPVQRALHV